jgi:transcriptional regulator with XRE-family HTH domain
MDVNIEFYKIPLGDSEQKPKNFRAGYYCCAGKKRRWVVKRSMMKKKTNFNLYLEKQLKDPGFAQKFIKSGKAWDLAIQLVSLRKKVGLSQKELAKKVGTSQQQISRLESPSYEGHSLSMLRRVAEVLGAVVHVDIQQKNDPSQWGVAEGRPLYGDKKSDLLKFELNLLRKEKVDYGRNFRIVDALYNEAVALGTLPLRNPLDGIEVDLKIAKVVNSV